jgi:predicted RNA-binding Zn-ribbon protein involved in translation (DUF1610 family)
VSELLAYLDKKTGTRVLCGACGEEIARVLAPGGERYIAFRLGWVVDPSDGTWLMSRRARDRVRHGRRPAFRRASRSRSALALDGREPPDDLAYIDQRLDGPAKGILLDHLPIRAACPKCGARSLLRGKGLNAQPYLRPSATVGPVRGESVVSLPPAGPPRRAADLALPERYLT